MFPPDGGSDSRTSRQVSISVMPSTQKPALPLDLKTMQGLKRSAIRNQRPKLKRHATSPLIYRMSPIPETCAKLKPSSWVRQLSEWSSMHGLPWYSRTSSVPFKVCIVLFTLAVLVALPAVVLKQVIIFHRDETVRNAVEWKTADNITYPNITICNSKFFDKDRLRAFNVSDDLASYMLLPLRSSPREQLDFSLFFYGESYRRYLEDLDRQLLSVLSQHDFDDILDLFHAVAISCNKFVTYCEAHTTFYVSSSHYSIDGEAGGGGDGNSERYPDCCQAFFDPSPMFTMSGTCYTSRAEIVENFPSAYSAIRIWMHVDEEDAPVFAMDMLGADASERTGVHWTLSYNDHPARHLATSPKKLATGESTVVSVSKVITDRRKLKEPCFSAQNDSFEDRYGMKQTRLNCYLAATHYLLPNCTTGVYAGLKRVDDLPTCMPHHALSTRTGHISLSDITSCAHDCLRTNFPMDISVGHFDDHSLANFLILNSENRLGANRSEIKGRMARMARESNMLHLYFDSFDYPIYTFYQESIMDLLSKIGGWMSLSIGGSIISIVELVCFCSYLACVVCKRRWKKETNK